MNAYILKQKDNKKGEIGVELTIKGLKAKLSLHHHTITSRNR